jgi:hypothetical protein
VISRHPANPAGRRQITCLVTGGVLLAVPWLRVHWKTTGVLRGRRGCVRLGRLFLFLSCLALVLVVLVLVVLGFWGLGGFVV